ncbi:hypothetical protein CEP54_001000 [Fusarium duplospermum]|uniref:Uncharacterized protein n=1 Tax=Fusarium duplospermum TaxID=1325734 RepID=A0A428R361_9HYPO|nr:hypothetical protein CEP54_001000 [Fusarium duplospermum]
MLGLSFRIFTVPVGLIFPRRQSTTGMEDLETLEAGMFDEPLDAKRRGLGLTDCRVLLRYHENEISKDMAEIHQNDTISKNA